jgi:hypothetical protein
MKETSQKTKVTKMVLLVLNPDNSARAVAYTMPGVMPDKINLNGTTQVNEKKFDKVTKNISVFFEKGFSEIGGNIADTVKDNQDDEASSE